VEADFGLTDEGRELVGLARRWVQDKVAPSASSYEEKKEFPRELFRQLGATGLAGIPYEERFGGGGQSDLLYLAVLEEVARGSLPFAVTVSVHHLCSFGIHQFGSEDLKQRYLPRLFSGEWLGAYALSEASSGSDAASLRTRAEREGDAYRLTGTKRFITHAGEAEAYRDLSEHGRSPVARAHAAVVEGMLAEDPVEANRLLAEGASALERVGFRVEAARTMVDLARAKARVGEDPRDVLQRARDLLIECDARAFLFEVDDAIAELGTEVDREGDDDE